MFLEYEEARRKYKAALRQYDEVLTEREEIFSKTQPNGIRYDKDKVQTSPDGDPFSKYVIEKEKRRIDERLKEAKAMVDERKRIMDEKERDLRLSDGLYDTVYRCRYINGQSVRSIAKMIGYSRSQTYRVIERIDGYVKMGQNATKCD